MPRVPMPERQVLDTPLPGVRVVPGPSPEAFGAGLGDTLIRLGKDWYKKEVDAADRTMAHEADREAADLQLEIQNQASQVSGKAVLGLEDQVKARWDEGIGKIRQRLMGNERVLSAFEERASMRAFQLRDSVSRHTSHQMNSFYDQEAEAGLSSALNVIRANPDSPIVFKNETQRMKSVIASQAVRKGWAGTVTAEMLQQPSFYQRYIDRGEEPPKAGETFFTDQYHSVQAQAMSAAHREVITTLNRSGQDIDASNWFERNKQALTAKDRDAIEPAIQEGSTRGEAQRLVRGLLAEGKTEAEILDHIDTKIDNPKIVDLAHTLVSRHFREQAAIKKEADDHAYLGAVNLVDTFHKSNPTAPIDPRLLVTPDAWTKFSIQERNALDSYGKSLTRTETPDRTNDDALWLDFLNLTPEQVGKLSRREFDMRYWSKFDNRHRERAETQWNTYKDALGKPTKEPNLKVTSSLTFKDQVRNAWNLSGLVDPSKEMSKWNQEEVSAFTRFEDQAARALQQYEITKLEGKRHATPDEVKAVVDEVKKQAVQKVFLPGTFYGYNERPAIMLGEDERRQAVVPLDKIPADSLADLRRYIQSMGKTVTDDKLRRAYGARMMNDRPAFERIVNE